MNLDFVNIKKQIIELIENKKEVTKETDFKNGGIYLLYVNNFTDDNIIPIYIGKTNNFQERHKEHLKELYALNRLSKDYYVWAILNNYFEGHYKSCKIFKYMVDNNCNLNDLHMVVLEENEVETERIQIEYDYINKYYSPFFGFNQLNTISLKNDYLNKGILSNYYLDDVKIDMVNNQKYMDYGFNKFNYMLAKGLFDIYGKNTFTKYKKIEELNDLKNKCNLYISEQNKLIHYINITSKEECKILCDKIIDSFFLENNLKSDDKKKQIIKYLLFGNEKDKNEVIRYMQRFAINKSEDIFELILKEKRMEIDGICQNIKTYQNKIDEYDELIWNIKLLIFSDIIPLKQYISYPLGDSYLGCNMLIDLEDNCLYINIEFSNHGKRYMNDDYPCILKVDYFYNNAKDVIGNSYFIKSEFDIFFDENDEYYINKNIYNIANYDPFSIWKYSKRREYNTISTTMEYYNGINEFTLKSNEKYDFKDVISQIDSLINQDTKIIYNSGCKKLIKRYEDMDSLVIKKIIKTIKY